MSQILQTRGTDPDSDAGYAGKEHRGSVVETLGHHTLYSVHENQIGYQGRAIGAGRGRKGIRKTNHYADHHDNVDWDESQQFAQEATATSDLAHP